MFMIIFISLILITAFVSLVFRGALNWLIWTIAAIAAIFGVIYLVVWIHEHKITMQIRKLICYEREHQGEVPTFLEILKEKGGDNRELIATYHKEMARYNRIHKIDEVDW